MTPSLLGTLPPGWRSAATRLGTNSLSSTVSQISPEGQDLGESRRNRPTGIAFGDGYVWVVNTLDHTISRIRARDGKVWNFPAPSDPGAIAYGEGGVWVTSKSGAPWSSWVRGMGSGSGTDFRRPGTGRVAVGLGSVWVANSVDGTVSRIDPASGRVADLIEVGAGPSG